MIVAPGRATGLPPVTRAALRYYGGKWRLAPWIIAHFPPHTTYCEPFCGAASVLLRKPAARYEVLNDLDQSVITFFRVLRERPTELIAAVRCTPFARAEVDLACAPVTDVCDELERARRLYVRAWQGRHGLPAQGRMGWRFERAATHRKTVVDDWRDTRHLWAIADRLRAVQLECDAALRVIARFDTPQTLHFVDPPYLPATRSECWRHNAYQYEMTTADHEALAAVLRSLAGMVVLCGYPSELYARLYAGWTVVTMTARTNSGTAVEALLLSPRAAALLHARQLPLHGLETPCGLEVTS